MATAKPRRGGADEAGESASEGADSVPTDPKKSRLVLWIILALALIAVGGGGLWFWLSAGSSAENEAEAAPAPLPLQFFSLDPPFVANFEGNQEYRFLQVTVRIATRDTQLITLLRDNEPILRNDLLMLFSNQQASVLSSLEGKEALRDDATRVLRESIESLAGDPEQLERVLFTSLVMQ